MIDFNILKISERFVTVDAALSKISTPLGDLSRRDAILFGAGAVGYGKILGDTLSKLARGDERPALHENKVKDTFALAFQTAINNADGVQARPLRILELGVGNDFRTVQRGLYEGAIKILDESEIYKGFDLYGIDVDSPSDTNLKKAKEKLSILSQNPTSLQFSLGDAAEINFPIDYFDVVTCCLVLCSVDDQLKVLNEIKRVLRPDGAFGWVEHVAVNKDLDDGHEILEFQQKFFDPLQQKVAHNCHLHRNTDDVILDVFSSSVSQGNVERFFVDDMWPVSCQVCGVVCNKI